MIKNPSFHKITLIAREAIKKGIPETLHSLINYLCSLKKEIFLEENTARMINNSNLPLLAMEQLKGKTDLLIVVGGDGSFLNAANIAVPQKIPILGINRGRLGFLTDITPNELEKINPILEGNYKEENRFLLDMRVTQKNKRIAQGLALNDVVLLPGGDTAKMIEFDIYINNEFVCHQRADGLIVTTPTGSTAYALSGGGPILHPQLNAIALVPMFPHTLSSRPIVVDGDSQIKITISDDHHAAVSPYISNDGRERVSILPKGNIHICKYQYPLRLIHPQDYNYYETLGSKLGWEKGIPKL